MDALDECDGDNDVKTIIFLLTRVNALRSVRLRVFITSRPELPIRLGFKNLQGKCQGLALHKIPEPIVEHDISTFLRYELARIRDRYNNEALEGLQLSPSWPGEDIIRDLAQMAVPSFIFAATVCRFLEDKGKTNPTKRLNKVLQYQTTTHNSSIDKLDAAYLPSLLWRSNTDQDRIDLLAEFRDIVGPIRTTNNFWIDKIKYHKALADNCIRLMYRHLKKDICNLQISGKLRSSIVTNIERCKGGTDQARDKRLR
ncbi:hypothetical protein QBC36DRAFT_347340 [Triangularia setosa]|uniref:NACHT domain-containing protein n=1 Tax=Triangularia setosa TaxID=2587417 RepID=A0AAN6W572_9PEZI|nr:hypothetical protein QBC36DRAFT_347340 [Podospora setosa]